MWSRAIGGCEWARAARLRVVVLAVSALLLFTGLPVLWPAASAHGTPAQNVALVFSASVDFSPFAVVYAQVWKQTWYTTDGYIAIISTHRVQNYLAELDNRISFSSGVEYGTPCVYGQSNLIGYTPVNGQTGSTCSGGPYGDYVGSGGGWMYVTPGIPCCFQTWRTTTSGNTRLWWKEGGYTASWGELNVARAGYQLTQGDQISFYVWYHFTVYRIFWLDHYYYSQSWTYYI